VSTKSLKKRFPHSSKCKRCHLKKFYGEQLLDVRVYADNNGSKTIFDFEAVKISKDTLLAPEETRLKAFTFVSPTDVPSMDMNVSLRCAPVHGPDGFLKALKDKATRGRKDRALQGMLITKHKRNVPL